MKTRHEEFLKELTRLTLGGDAKLVITCEDDQNGGVILDLSIRGYPVEPSEEFPSKIMEDAIDALRRQLAGNISMQKFRGETRFNISEFTIDYGGIEIPVLELLPVSVRNLLRWGSNISMQKSDYLKTVGEMLSYRFHENLVEDFRTRTHNIENVIELFREFDFGGKTHKIKKFTINQTLHYEDINQSRFITADDFKLNVTTNIKNKDAKKYLSTELVKWNVKLT